MTEQIYVGERVGYKPVPDVPSYKWECEDCGDRIWIDKRAAQFAIRCDDRICGDCALERREGGQKLEVARWKP